MKRLFPVELSGMGYFNDVKDECWIRSNRANEMQRKPSRLKIKQVAQYKLPYLPALCNTVFAGIAEMDTAVQT